MKAKKFILLIAVLLSSIGAFAQSGTEKISISFQNIPLKEAIQQIEKASNYVFFYDATEVNTEQSVSLNAQNEEIRLAIRRMFEPTDISFNFQKNQILLEKKKLVETTKKGAEKTISGVITDQQGEPIIGATVTIKGTVTGVLSDIDGKYSLNAREGETLEFRYIGYNSIEQKVKKGNVMNITLAESNINLVDQVIVGYGSQNKQSDVSSVKGTKPS